MDYERSLSVITDDKSRNNTPDAKTDNVGIYHSDTETRRNLLNSARSSPSLTTPANSNHRKRPIDLYDQSSTSPKRTPPHKRTHNHYTQEQMAATLLPLWVAFSDKTCNKNRSNTQDVKTDNVNFATGIEIRGNLHKPSFRYLLCKSNHRKRPIYLNDQSSTSQKKNQIPRINRWKLLFLLRVRLLVAIPKTKTEATIIWIQQMLSLTMLITTAIRQKDLSDIAALSLSKYTIEAWVQMSVNRLRLTIVLNFIPLVQPPIMLIVQLKETQGSQCHLGPFVVVRQYRNQREYSQQCWIISYLYYFCKLKSQKNTNLPA